MKKILPWIGWALFFISIWVTNFIYLTKSAAPIATCCYSFKVDESRIVAEGTWVGEHLAAPINQTRIVYNRGEDRLAVTTFELLDGIGILSFDEYPIVENNENIIVGRIDSNGLLSNYSKRILIEINLADKSITQNVTSSDPDSQSLFLRLSDAGLMAQSIQSIQSWPWPASYFRETFTRDTKEIWNEVHAIKNRIK